MIVLEPLGTEVLLPAVLIGYELPRHVTHAHLDPIDWPRTLLP